MDVQRTIIVIGLAVVSYMLVLAWNEDYGQVAPTQQEVVSVPEIQAEIEATPALAASETEEEFSTPEELANPLANDESAPSASKANQIITVRTDVLDLAIDLYGGNITTALLPEHKIALGSDQPLALLESQRRQYTVESGLYGKNGFDSSKNGPTPVYTVKQDKFELQEGSDELLVDLLFKSDSGVEVVKRYTFKRGEYLANVSFILKNDSSTEWQGNLSGKIVRDESLDPSSQTSMGMQSYLGMVLSNENEPYEKYDFDDLRETPLNIQAKGGWIAFIQHYFLSAWIPTSDQQHTYQTRYKGGLHLMGFVSPATTVAPGETKTVEANVYIGPKLVDQLELAAPKLDKTVDYGILFFIGEPLFWLLNFLHGLVGNWGIAIILVTVIVKAIFFKLSAASYRSMANMRKVAPKLQSLKERYGDDRQKMSQAMMDLYKKEKINPLGGCLPILVQMPVFIALYWVLLESVQLRHAPFFLWITDLSVKDPYFILPILMGISMYFQMQLNPAPPDPMQARIMKMMPFMMTFFFLWFPAGLVLYWFVNNLLSIAQQWVITKKIESAG